MQKAEQAEQAKHAEPVAPAASPQRRLKSRLANLGWAFVFFSPIALAMRLTPSHSGVGTHQQLGLPPCTFLWLTSFPCPFCGMTTAWTYAAHLDPVGALRAQPMGFVLFLVAGFVSIALVVRAAMGVRVMRPEQIVAIVPIPVWWTFLGGTIAAWIYKIASMKGLI